MPSHTRLRRTCWVERMLELKAGQRTPNRKSNHCNKTVSVILLFIRETHLPYKSSDPLRSTP
jgi:hypothetical protein